MIGWSPSASRDFESVREYLDLHFPANAESVSARILDAVDSIEQFPRRGRPDRMAGTRELIVLRTPYIMIYRLQGAVVQILRILHGAQRWPLI